MNALLTMFIRRLKGKRIQVVATPCQQKTPVPARRRPRDYYEYLPHDGQVRVYDRICRAYENRPYPDDSAHEAVVILKSGKQDLRKGPPFEETSTPAWRQEVEDALVGFVTSHHVQRLVTAKMYRTHEVAAPRGFEVRDLGYLSNEERVDRAAEQRIGASNGAPTSNVIMLGTISGRARRSEFNGQVTFEADTELNAEQIDPQREGGCNWIENNALAVKLHRSLRNRLANQPAFDPLLLQIFDQLTADAELFDAWAHDPTSTPPVDEVFRGDQGQVDAKRLLASLQKRYQEEGWTIDLLRTKFAKLCRTMRSWTQAIQVETPQEEQPVNADDDPIAHT
jgi:hypothetical protein